MVVSEQHFSNCAYIPVVLMVCVVVVITAQSEMVSFQISSSVQAITFFTPAQSISQVSPNLKRNSGAFEQLTMIESSRPWHSGEKNTTWTKDIKKCQQITFYLSYLFYFS